MLLVSEIRSQRIGIASSFPRTEKAISMPDIRFRFTFIHSIRITGRREEKRRRELREKGRKKRERDGA